MSGYYSPEPGATECTPCPPGTHQPSRNATACLPCPAGSYAPYWGAWNHTEIKERI